MHAYNWAKQQANTYPTSDCLSMNDVFSCAKQSTVCLVHMPWKNFSPPQIYRCSNELIKWQSTFHFFGSTSFKQHVFLTMASSHALHNEWIKSKISPGVGKLSPITQSTWTTHNIIKPRFVWPTSHTRTVTNSHLAKTKIFHNHIKNEIINPLNMSTLT